MPAFMVIIALSYLERLIADKTLNTESIKTGRNNKAPASLAVDVF
jgi:hypothetical protein